MSLFYECQQVREREAKVAERLKLMTEEVERGREREREKGNEREKERIQVAKLLQTDLDQRMSEKNREWEVGLEFERKRVEEVGRLLQLQTARVVSFESEFKGEQERERERERERKMKEVQQEEKRIKFQEICVELVVQVCLCVSDSVSRSLSSLFVCAQERQAPYLVCTLPIYICICMYVCTYVCMYIYRERKRQRERASERAEREREFIRNGTPWGWRSGQRTDTR
jgi:hypothetical protein